MSCGCGGRRVLPHSVSVKMTALELAVRSLATVPRDGSTNPSDVADEVVNAADNYVGFLTNHLDHDPAKVGEIDDKVRALDAAPAKDESGKVEPPVHLRTPEQRQSFLGQGIRTLQRMGGSTAEILESRGIHTIFGLLTSSAWTQLPSTMLPVIYELNAIGLQFNAPLEDIHAWVAEGP